MSVLNNIRTSVIYEPRGRAGEYAALAANLYAGCSHGCRYCYVPGVLHKTPTQFHANPAPRPGIIDELRKDCAKLAGTKCPPVLLSFTTDPYQPLEAQIRLTREAIKVMCAAGLSVEVLTKGGTRACRDFDLLGPNDAFATTLTFLDSDKSQEWEPGAAPPEDRLEAMKEAHARGIPVWVSLEPVIDPNETLRIIDATHEFVDLYKVGVLNHHPHAKAINWGRFGALAVKRLEELGCNYFLKHDLERAMGFTA